MSEGATATSSETRTVISEKETAIRLEATTPARSAWVAANAGSGKTSLLRDRVMRLLLDGVPPDRILCLTYTRAAAAEMSGRIFNELAKWATLDDEQLEEAIRKLTGSVPDPKRAARARTLFAEAVETPGGLKIQTIHAFAERILHLFPIEAGVPFDFTVLDDAEAGQLREGARRAALDHALDYPDGEIGRSFHAISSVTGPDKFSKAVETAIAALAIFRRHNPDISVQQAMGDQAYATLFSTPLDVTEEALEAMFFAHAPDQAEVRAAIADLVAEPTLLASSNNRMVHDNLRRIATAPSTAMRRQAWLKLLLTGGETARKAMLTQPAQKKLPHIHEMLSRFVDRADDFVSKRNRQRALQRSRALRTFADHVLDLYASAKAARNTLDFDDLIARLALMLRQGQSAWVMMKLDASIEHILVDEAQDTTPQMWEIIKALTTDFFAGEGQTRFQRSLFVVGDEKQSIFSFQGAKPEVFDEVRQHFGVEAHVHGDLIRKPVALRYSFRSSADVLAGVDQVFAGDRGEGLGAGEVSHVAAKSPFPGLVELWPLIQPLDDDKPEDDPDQPVDAVRKTSPAVANAQRIADRIAEMLANDERHFKDGTVIGPGDILILAQTRNTFFDAMLRELRRRNIPVAGADRLRLGDEIAVHDLIAIGQAACLPEDDLSLASALKSPIFGLDDAAIERLCRNRQGALRAAIRDGATDDPLLAALDTRLQGIEAAAASEPPFLFFSRLLTEPAFDRSGISGKKAIRERLGPDVIDAIEAFLADAMDFAERNPPSLTRFLAAQADRDIQIKRDLDQATGAVRVMTVHASKGLEARIVFLGDTTAVPDKRKEPDSFLMPTESGDLLVWTGEKKREPAVMAEIRQRQRAALFREYRRLLYVAMTRAEDRVYVTGYPARKTGQKSVDGEAPAKRKKVAEVPPLERNWHQLVHEALKGLPGVEQVEFAGSEEPLLRWQPQRAMAMQAKPDQPVEAVPPAIELPAWLSKPVASEVPDEPPLRPSRMVAPAVMANAGPDDDGPRLRGIAIHRLFELLPPLPDAERESIGRWIIRDLIPGLSPEDGDSLLLPVLAAIGSEKGQRFFGARSRAEVAISGQVMLANGDTRKVIGRLDRLVEAKDGLDLLDIKTGERRNGGMPAILRQMALYRAVLASIFPDREIRAHILWSRSGAFEELDTSALDHALALALATITEQ